jgi:hypothetical protein
MIQDQSKDITLIVYNTPKPPKYIKLNKKLINILIFFIPVIVIISVASSLISSAYLKRKLEQVKSQEPELIVKYKKEIAELNQEIKSLKSTNISLTEKISSGGKESTSPLHVMALFTTPLGFEDKRAEDQAKIENMNIDVVNEKVHFRFDLINNFQETSKLSGYVTVVQYHNDGLNVFPAYALTVDSPNFEYSKGESFTVSRFRPVITEFIKPKSNVVWYKVYLFSRTGNLLAYKTAGPFTIK